MISIDQLGTDEDHAQVGELIREYFEWVNARWKADLGYSFDMQSFLEHDLAGLEIFFPPFGRLLLATEGSQVAGVACLRRIGKEIGEIKRTYVRPEFRGLGIGRALLEALIVEAREIGYSMLRLDSASFMKVAHSLYRSTGFQEIEPYPESEVPPEYQAHIVFMEKRLQET